MAGRGRPRKLLSQRSRSIAKVKSKTQGKKEGKAGKQWGPSSSVTPLKMKSMDEILGVAKVYFTEEESEANAEEPSKMSSLQGQSVTPPILKFGPLPDLNSEDIEEEVSYWNSSLVCYVLGANPPIGPFTGFARRVEISVVYEWIPLQCRNCQGIGHSTLECKKTGKKEQQEWRPKKVDKPPIAPPKSMEMDEEGFQLVRNGRRTEKAKEIPIQSKGFGELISKAWKERVQGTPMFKLIDKLKILKKEIRVFNWSEVGDIAAEDIKVQSLLKAYQDSLQRDPLNSKLIHDVRMANEQYKKTHTLEQEDKRIEFSPSKIWLEIGLVIHLKWLARSKLSKSRRRVMVAAIAALIYQLWQNRNESW
uniref:Uncharacterized protein n=1 Tax=Cannabis sativa TaxID=3483 RepID=A0A803NHW0_CANSA